MSPPDRFCAIRVSLSTPLSNMQSSIIVLCAYLPSCDHPIEEFTDCLNKFVSVISALEADGPYLFLVTLMPISLFLETVEVIFSMKLSKIVTFSLHPRLV